MSRNERDPQQRGPSPAILAIVARIERTETAVPAELDALDLLDPDEDAAHLERLCGFALAAKRKLGKVARLAALRGDEATLDDLTRSVNKRLGDQLEHAAYELLVSGQVDPSFRIFVRLCRTDVASLQALNNFCWALLKVSEELLPEDLIPLMDKAEAAAEENVSIWHNLACAWVRFENTERALDAVEAATRTDYHDLERMETDEDLARLFDHPRYIAAFASRQK